MSLFNHRQSVSHLSLIYVDRGATAPVVYTLYNANYSIDFQPSDERRRENEKQTIHKMPHVKL